jgi:prevent-host-death family protein
MTMEHGRPLKTMPAGEFKARCLQVMEDVKQYRTSVVITKKGKPVAKLVPFDEPHRDVFGCMAQKIRIIGDVESPVLPRIEQWDMLRDADAGRLGARPRKTKRSSSRRPAR